MRGAELQLLGTGSTIPISIRELSWVAEVALKDASTLPDLGLFKASLLQPVYEIYDELCQNGQQEGFCIESDFGDRGEMSTKLMSINFSSSLTC